MLEESANRRQRLYPACDSVMRPASGLPFFVLLLDGEGAMGGDRQGSGSQGYGPGILSASGTLRSCRVVGVHVAGVGLMLSPGVMVAPSH